MSSRILRGAAVHTEPLHLRAVGGNAVAHGSARATGSGEDAEIQARIQDAVEQGRREGQVAAAQQASQQAALQARQQLDPVLAGLKQMVEALTGQRRQLRAESEEDMVQLAIAIGRRILHRELAADPEAVLGVVKAAFARLNAREIHRLRVSPGEAHILEQHRGALQFPQALEVVSDGSLTAGSVVFETTRGELDASVETQLSEIGRGLTDVLRRRLP